MSRIRLVGATAMCVALTATACSGSSATIAAEQPGPIAATTSVANQVTDVRTGPTTTKPPVARQNVEIRVRVAVGGAGSTDEAPQTATLQIPTDISDPTPAVVLLHGAGGPTRHSLAPMADAVAALGIPVLNASWLADPKRLGESVADAVCAVAYAYQNASSWGADPDRIIVMGHSGGGQVGMLAGLAPEAFPECERASEAHVWAYIGLAGDPASAAPGGNLRRFLVGSPELLKRMDSYNYIGGNPGLIVRFVHGTSDATVPIELTGAFHDALISAGYDSELIPINGAGHADPANPTRDAGLAALDQLAILASQMPVDASPIEWGWFPGSSPDPVHSPAFRAGDYCYGNSEPPPPSNRDMTFLDGTLTVLVGRHVSPTVSFEDDDGTTDLGNPFGEDAWLCTVASDGESVLAVGSDVWWSNDGITWHIVEAFRDIGGPHLNGSKLVWAAVGPLGYVVLGQSWGDGWYSPDLTTWYEIAIEDGPDDTERGWFGPGNVTVSDEMIVIGAENAGAWIGTPNN